MRFQLRLAALLAGGAFFAACFNAEVRVGRLDEASGNGGSGGQGGLTGQSGVGGAGGFAPAGSGGTAGVGGLGGSGGQGGAGFGGGGGTAGVGVEPEWACIGQEPPALSDPVTLSFLLVDGVSRTPVTNGSAHACERADVNCEAPLGADVSIDGGGGLTIVVPALFDGYIEVEPAPAEPLGFLPTMLAIAPNQLRRGRLPREALLLQQQVRETIASLVETTADPARGDLVVTAFNCLDSPASGVTLAFDELGAPNQPSPFYLVNGVPNPSSGQTDASGVWGLINVASTVLVSSTLAGSGISLGDAGFVANVRPGWVTVVYVGP